jgi:hypothetical protein
MINSMPLMLSERRALAKSLCFVGR